MLGSAMLALASAFAQRYAQRIGKSVAALTSEDTRRLQGYGWPAKGLMLQFRRNGQIKAQVRTSQIGSYRVTLRPGRYAVTTPALRPYQRLTPQLVRVPRGRVGRVDLHLDTGLQ